MYIRVSAQNVAQGVDVGAGVHLHSYHVIYEADLRVLHGYEVVGLPGLVELPATGARPRSKGTARLYILAFLTSWKAFSILSGVRRFRAPS